MSRKAMLVLLSAAALLAAPALAQFPKLVTDFENPSWQPFVTVVMFRNPNFSTSSFGLDPADPNSTYLTDRTLNSFSTVHSGTRGSEITWGFANPAHYTPWVRIVTFNADKLPNPALHLDGKVRVWLAAKAYTSNTYAVQVPTGHLLFGLGIRESGAGEPQGGNGGISGDVEWVGVNARIAEIYSGLDGLCNTTADPNDVQLVPVGSPAGAYTPCIGAGADGTLQTAPAGDDAVRVTPIGMYSVPTDNVIRQYEFDLPALQAAGKVFSFAGNGTLGATPNNRGTLEHLIFTNDPTNGAVNAKVFLVNIDDVEFEAPVIDPPKIITEPNAPQPLETLVRVGNIDPNAAQVAVFRLNPDATETQLGLASPAGAAEVDVTTTPLASNIRLVARQTIGANTSDNSVPVIVKRPGNSPLRIAMAVRETDQYDHALPCGGDGTGFDASQPSTLEFIGSKEQDGFGIPTPPRFVPQFDWFEIQFKPCDPEYGVTLFSGDGELGINAAPNHTNGVWEGLYFRIDDVSPGVGPYTVYLDDLTVKTSSGQVVCLIDDFESYTPAQYIVADCTGNGQADTAAAPTDVQVVPVGATTFCGQIIVAPGADGTLETVKQGDDGTSSLHARFNYPGVAGTQVGVATTPSVTAVTTEQAHSGTKSLKVNWAFVDSSNMRNHLRLTTNGSTATNPPETFHNPDSVIPFSLDGTLCDGTDDLLYSVWVRLAPTRVPADCDLDGDTDLADMACYQGCFATSPVPAGCTTFDVAPNGAPDGVVGMADLQLINYLFVGPGL